VAETGPCSGRVRELRSDVLTMGAALLTRAIALGVCCGPVLGLPPAPAASAQSRSLTASVSATEPTAGILNVYAQLNATPGLTSGFGSGIAVSADGRTAVIGGETDNAGEGAAWVFVRIAGGWVQDGPKLVPGETGPVNSFALHFGAKVAISANGDTVLVGDREGGAPSGWIFVRSGAGWRQQGRRLTPRDQRVRNPSDAGVAISGDGRTAVLSGETEESTAADGAWIFVRTRSGWRQQGRRLTGRGESSNGFGYSTALSADGSTLLLGAGGGGFSGSAWIFSRSHSRWMQQGPRLPRSGRRENFGKSVALSANGRIALISRTTEAARWRAVFVYALSHGTWRKTAVLHPPHGTDSRYFGYLVALSGDARTAIVSMPSAGSEAGAAYVFSHRGSRWTQTATLGGINRPGELAFSADGSTVLSTPNGDNPTSTAVAFYRSASGWSEQTPTIMPSDESGRDEPTFGYSVAVSADGTTALVGEYGGAWVFVRSGSTWTQQGPRLAAPGSDGRFGLSVALSGDGNTAAIGDPGERGPAGAVFVFHRTGGAWTQQGPALRPSDATDPRAKGFQEGFGWRVAISADAGAILVGDPSYAEQTGAAWVFMRTGTSWIQQGPKLTGGGEAGEAAFGYSVALNSDGSTAVIGGPYDQQHGRAGAIWAFSRTGGAWAQQGSKLIPVEEGAGFIGIAVALSADGATALAGAGESALVFVRSGTTWSQQGRNLSSANRLGNSPLGQSVALSADGNTALIGGIPADDCGRYMYEPCSSAGSVWAFRRSATSWTPRGTLAGRREFGSSVALSADGSTALIGSPIEEPFVNSIQGGNVSALSLGA
jgi:FG-GAP repeat